ncbi:MAG: hypothetical protein HZB14_08940 [Actinobacteria bacterium]|nr:hypothetical protein [Actinomycetota bacterium]
MRFALLAAVLAAAVVLAGCEASVGTPSEKEQIEKIISDQLPGKVKDQVDNPAVEEVTCVEGETGKYDCIAKLSYEVDGKAKSEDVAIAGSCDEENCIWETKE